MQTPTLEAVINARQEVKRKRDALNAEYKEKDLKLKEMEDALEAHLLGRIAENDGKPLYLENGTRAQRRTDIKVQVTDWPAFHGLIAASVLRSVVNGHCNATGGGQNDEVIEKMAAWARENGSTIDGLNLLQKRAGRNAVVEEIEEGLPEGIKVVDYYNGSRDPTKLPPLPLPPGVRLNAEYVLQIEEKK